MYFSVHNKTLDAAGVEAYGCAYITTGLLDGKTIEKAIGGDRGSIKDISYDLNWTVEHKDIFRTQYILDLDGKVIASDKNLNTVNIEIGDVHPIDKDIIEQVVNEKHPSHTKIYNVNGEKTLTGIAPIYKDQDSSKEVIAISAIDFDGSVVSERTLDTLKSSMFLGALPLLLVVIATSFFIRKVVNPINKVTEDVKQIKEGDLTIKIDVESNDEIGQLANDINELTEHFRGILSDIMMNTTQLAATSDELFASSQNISDISERNSQNLTEVNELSNSQLEYSNEINEIIQTSSDHIQSISERLSSFTEVSKETVEESIQGTEVMNETDGQMNNINEKMEGLAQTMISLQNKSNQIDRIIHLINDISEQTNILSLNATIEAARAGESGKGFAVVADEVRKLAEESKNSTTDIRELLSEIQNEISVALEESEQGNEETQQGIKKVKEAATIFEDISEKIQSVNRDFVESSSSVEVVSSELEEIVAKMGEVVDLLEDTSLKTDGVSEAIADQNNSFNEIVEVTDNLAQLSETLKEKISYFKI